MTDNEFSAGDAWLALFTVFVVWFISTFVFVVVSL